MGVAYLSFHYISALQYIQTGIIHWNCHNTHTRNLHCTAELESLYSVVQWCFKHFLDLSLSSSNKPVSPSQAQINLSVSSFEKFLICVTSSLNLMLGMVILLETIFWPRLVMWRSNPPLSIQAKFRLTPQIRRSSNIWNAYNCYCLIFLALSVILQLLSRSTVVLLG